MRKYFFTSESVTEGHPDKVCDQISDAILDACLKDDPNSRVAAECLTKTGMVMVAGEISTKTYVDIPKITRGVLRDIGYNRSDQGIEWETCAVLTHIEEQSPDISQGVTKGRGQYKSQGAGDQGMMFGFATNETPEYMPLPIYLAHKITKRLAEVRKKGIVDYLGPDGKSQVTVEYIDGKPKAVNTIVVATQHNEGISQKRITKDIKKYVINPVCKKWTDRRTKYYINATGKFVRGGPYADAGVTGRKIIVDTYGGMGAHGGGAFSGKDPSKVDRSASYMARYVAKNIVAADLAQRCEIQLAYVIGYADPVSVFVDTFDTGRISDAVIEKIVKRIFDLTPEGIVRNLKLKRPIYQKTASYGHFGRNDKDFTWEKLDKVNILKKEAGL